VARDKLSGNFNKAVKRNIELVFTYLDELLEKQEEPEPRKQIDYKLL
jgi:hypothetical protein